MRPVIVKTWILLAGLLAGVATVGAQQGYPSKPITIILAMPDIQQKMASLGVEPFVASPDDFAARMKAGMAKYAEVIKKRNIKLD